MKKTRKNMKIAIAVSGGVDSLYALVSLKEAGHDVAAIHARFISVAKENDPVPMLSVLCKGFKIPFHVIDLKEEFSREMIRPFLESYARSETPNPCAHCNKIMKFGRLLDIAKNLSVQALATGHYVHMEEYFCRANNKKSYGLCLKSAQDTTKDQSYFLALTPLEKLRFALFPLAGKLKKDIISELTSKNISIPIKKESQEVCFVPNDNYREFIEVERERRGIVYVGQGDIIFRDVLHKTEEKKVGTHDGLWRYTEGQRKGLGIAWTEPLYVIKKDKETNTLYVGTKQALECMEAHAIHVNFLVSPEYWHGNDVPYPFLVRTRFREKPSPARVFLEYVANNAETNTASLSTLNTSKIENCVADSPLSFRVELGTPNTTVLLEKWLQEKDMQILQKHIIEKYLQSKQTNMLWHVQEEDKLFENEEDKQFNMERVFWNNLPIKLIAEFENPKQVHAKGQILAIYDINGFVLAGGILE